MPEYLVAVYMKEGEPLPPADEMQQTFADVEMFNQRLQAEGAWVFAGGLLPASAAVVVDGREGDAVTSNATLSQAELQISGFWVIEVSDREAAMAWAAEASRACRRVVEVREFQG